MPTNIINLAQHLNYQTESVVSREILRKPTGTVTLFAFDAGQGLSEHTAPFDALVLDAGMPDLSGFAVMQAMPATAAPPERTVMLLPAHEQRSGVALCAELGVGAWLVKPVTPSDLLDGLQKGRF